jgi:hypothetical protein
VPLRKRRLPASELDISTEQKAARENYPEFLEAELGLVSYYHLAPACDPPSIRIFSPLTMFADSKYNNASTISDT